MTSIFISYRRQDSQSDAGRIYDRLVQRFGRETLFKDVDDIPGGVDFRFFLQNTLQQCTVVLAIIGPSWVNAHDGQGRRRLDNPADWVRLEIGEALRRQDVLVVPVLVGNALMPQMDELPDDLKGLVYRNARMARPDPDFHKDINRLIIELEPHVTQTQPPAQPPVTSIDTSQPRLAQYREEVRHCLTADNGEITPISRSLLERLRAIFNLTAEEANAVETEELQPYKAKADAIASYRTGFADVLQYENPPSQETRARLQRFQQILALSNHDVQAIEAPLLQTAEDNYEQAERQRQETEHQRQETERQRQEEALSSEHFGANYYANLRELLAAQDWQAADRETAERMLEVMSRQNEGWLRIEDMQNFPCLDLRTIDRLWVNHSQGKFGFSVQTKIWQSCDRPTTYNRDWETFGEAIGWRTKGDSATGDEPGWLIYSQLTFDLLAPTGHLPGGSVAGWFGLGWFFSSLASRLAKCSIQ